MASIVRTYRKYWPTDAFLTGKLLLADLMLCSFSTKELTEAWQVSTDQSWGGKSSATVSWQPWETKPGKNGTVSKTVGGTVGGTIEAQPWKLYKGKPAKAAPAGVMQSEVPLTGNEEEEAPLLEEGGFFQFSGELSTEKAAAAKVGGFCGTRPPRREEALCLPDGYGSVEIRVRTDGRTYEVNFEPQSGILNDLYQGYVRTPPGRWQTLTLPLDRLLLTGQGQIRVVQRKWDNELELKSIGFTLADGMAGPFQLDVAWIALVRKVGKEKGGEEKDEKGNAPRKMPPRPKNGVMSW